jgi:hypothetical protein
VHQLFIDLKNAYDLVRREVSYSIFIEFGVPMKLLRLIKMCLNEMYSKVCIGKHLSDNFPMPNGLKHGDPLLLLLFTFALHAIRKVCEPGGSKIDWDSSALNVTEENIWTEGG